ncbi:histidine triad nucleotide-binding protein [Solihabitans fulvus]|uniref:Histidine triad nucleotide-binding protein n=1 Tax=Solihabitans fulvus TaxID=1892852 RepID=A0A5B2XT21_9PSEU|nr:histidine triad nucleotide-binding protein [Solihabitans fulvus]KAA2266070.1 histidine triad nucleotide-binding protein [Solihabitans fulvus]
MTASDCLFCRIVAGEIPATVVRETPTALAFRDINPQASTHVLVVPKSHHPDVVALAKAEPEALAEVFAVAGEVAEAEGIAEGGYRLLFNTGADAGQTVFHAHLHLLGGEWLGGLVGGALPPA